MEPGRRRFPALQGESAGQGISGLERKRDRVVRAKPDASLCSGSPDYSEPKMHASIETQTFKEDSMSVGSVASPSANEIPGPIRGFKEIADAVIALAAFATGPAILFLAMDPLVAYVPGISAKWASIFLVVAAIAVPSCPAISFITGFRPQRTDDKASKRRLWAIVVILIVSLVLNVLAIQWNDDAKEHRRELDAAVMQQKQADIDRDRAALAQAVSAAVEKGLRDAGKCSP